MSFVRCCLVLLLLNCVSCYVLLESKPRYDQRFSYWPSFRNGVEMMARRRRELQNQVSTVRTFPHEGGSETQKVTATTTTQKPLLSRNESLGRESVVPSIVKEQSMNTTHTTLKEPATTNSTITVKPPQILNSTTKVDATANDKNKLTSGVLVRGVTVFGAFLLIASAYFLFYRKRNKSNDLVSTHNANDTNQFRYGVLQSEDRRDNMELSHVPLTMETDDEDDEDLEIFDLEQKKKTLSYVNLQQNDEEIVFENSKGDGTDKDQLLLDIEEGPSDTLINWTNNSNRSML